MMSNRSTTTPQSISNMAIKVADSVVQSEDLRHTNLRHSVLYIRRKLSTIPKYREPDHIVTDVINRLDVIQQTLLELSPRDESHAYESHVSNLYLTLALLRDVAGTLENYLGSQPLPPTENMADGFDLKPSRVIPKNSH